MFGLVLVVCSIASAWSAMRLSEKMQESGEDDASIHVSSYSDIFYYNVVCVPIVF